MSECRKDGQPSMRIEKACGAVDPRDGLYCTLTRGHGGEHTAHGCRNQVYVTWPQEKIVLPNQSPELDALLLKAQDLAEEMRKHNLTHLGQLQLR